MMSVLDDFREHFTRQRQRLVPHRLANAPFLAAQNLQDNGEFIAELSTFIDNLADEALRSFRADVLRQNDGGRMTPAPPLQPATEESFRSFCDSLISQRCPDPAPVTSASTTFSINYDFASDLPGLSPFNMVQRNSAAATGQELPHIYFPLPDRAAPDSSTLHTVPSFMVEGMAGPSSMMERSHQTASGGEIGDEQWPEHEKDSWDFI
jgi:hypothetical protein